MKKYRNRILLLLAGILLSGCASTQVKTTMMPQSMESQPLAYPHLTIYSALPEEEIAVYLSAFRKDTGISVSCERLSAGEMIQRVQQEQEDPQVSVLLGGAAEHYVQANDAGLLEPYQSPELMNVPKTYLDKAQVWNPIYIGVICFVCNRDWFEQNHMRYPTRWDDLLSPAFSGQVVLGSPDTSGTSSTMLAALVQQRGEANAFQYLEELRGNIKDYTYSGIEPVEWVKRGECAVGIAFSHDGRRAVLDGYPVELCYPEDGTGFEIGACALVRNGPKEEQENAKRFIDWMTSQRGQECYIEAKSSRLPANNTARSADGLPEIKDLNIVEYDPEWVGNHRNDWVKKFQERVIGAEARKGLT